MNKAVKNQYIYIIITAITAAVVILILQAVTGQWFFLPQHYNSYILQAQSWLEGRLDLGMDYPYLELAIFEGKYFVSFPPFPSYVMLPFTALGWNSCDSFIAFVVAVGGAVFAYKAAAEFVEKKYIAMLFALLATIGSNWLFTSVNAWVWFIAQNMAFALTMAAVYYAARGKAGLSFALWACAVGCRPFQIIYISVLLYLLYTAFKKQNPLDTVFSMIKKHILSVIPACIIAASYMILNYARFGSITEFGHNYLPEFMRVSTGQFNTAYITANFKNLFRLPELDGGRLVFQSSDGFCIFIASPIFVSFLVYTVIAFIKGDKRDRRCIGAAVLLIAVHLVSITAHKTMGGSHYGNRYTNDTLPMVMTACAYVYGKFGKRWWINIIPLIAGAALNVMWVLMYFVNN